MAEVKNPLFYKNFQFDLTQFRLDLFRLACYFLASPRLEGLICERAKKNGDTEVIENPLLDVESQFLNEEVGRILLQTAVFVRVLLDEHECDPAEMPNLICGTLESRGKSSPLTLRDACNKIIHTQNFNYDHEAPLEPICEPGPRNPTIYLYGSVHSGMEWKANVNVLDFVQNCILVLRSRYLADFISDPSYNT